MENGKDSKGKFCIWRISADQPSSRVFDEIALSLHDAFGTLGHDAPIVEKKEDVAGMPVVLGCNYLPDLEPDDIPADSIIYNLEQIYHDSPWLTDSYLKILRARVVWDYSLLNISRLRRLGVERIRLCEIGYSPSLSRIKPSEQDIDVLHYGMMNKRRQAVIDALNAGGHNAVAVSDLYGEERDALIARAKIVVNVHYYAAHIFEIARVSYLLANRCFVVSETGVDKDLEDYYVDGVVFAEYDQLVETCMSYLGEEEERARISSRGHELIKAKPQARILADMLSLSMPLKSLRPAL